MLLRKIERRILDGVKRFMCDKKDAVCEMNNLILLNESSLKDTERLQTKEDIYKWIQDGINCFKEWYQPVDFGNGIVAHVTTPPDWKPMPDLLNDNGYITTLVGNSLLNLLFILKSSLASFTVHIQPKLGPKT